MDCVFCNYVNNERGQILFENNDCVFIEYNDEVLKGWGIIIPKKHRETVFDLTLDEWKSTYLLLDEAKRYIDSKYSPDGYNVGWNVGEIGGQTVFHAHLHVIAKYQDEPYARKGIRHWIKQKENKRV